MIITETQIHTFAFGFLDIFRCAFLKLQLKTFFFNVGDFKFEG